MRSQIAGMKTHWEDEKRLIQNIRNDQRGRSSLGIEEQRAEREGNLARVAELRYGRSNELKRQLEAANARIWKTADGDKKCSRKRWMTKTSPR
jgi:ATP-dependent Clp protease ATP-binding subunit ClpB